MVDLNNEKIDELIAKDQIVWGRPRLAQMEYLQGKFVKGSKLNERRHWTYSFCPYKKGVNYPFLTAQNWEIDEGRDSGLDGILKKALTKSK